MLTLHRAKAGWRRVGAFTDRALGLKPPAKQAPPPQYAKGNWGPDRKRAIVGELISDAVGAMWSACWRRGR